MESLLSIPIEVSQRLLGSPAGAHWRRLGIQHRHGIALPLFSLRTNSSGGIGEFLDLIPLIDWCASVGFTVIQLLPLNDSGPDPSPYSALSAYALNPLNLSLSALSAPPSLDELFALNQHERIDYELLRSKKLALVDAYVANHRGEIERRPDFQDFVHREEWLTPYACFKELRVHNQRTPWWEWPEEDRLPNASHPQRCTEAIHRHAIVQFLCDLQLREVRKYADAKGVLLLGDIPILLSPNSADVWWHQDYFDLSAAVGAPPDQFSDEGQNWGFPLYRWDQLRADDFAWWRKRLQLAAHYFHLYRIDHIVGFFRLWKIPEGKSGKEGVFVPKTLKEALTQGRELLTMMLESAPLLPIGEDLGSVPPEVRLEMSHLGICGTKVMRWERRWEEDGEFLPIEEYAPESLSCVSTHDTEPLAVWWADHPEESEEYAKQKDWPWEPELSIQKRRLILRDCHHSASLFHINPLQEYLALFPDLVHADPKQDRINIPGTADPENWTYRFKITVEQLRSHQALARSIGELLA
jgi:4-alpha-glucanotransferase